MELNKIKENFNLWQTATSHRIVVCAVTGCPVNGSPKVYEELKR
jgi:NADH:ubiquinone oxidoreductase subunit E